MAKGKVIQRVFELKDKFSPALKNIQKGSLQFKKDVRDLKKAGADAFNTIKVGAIAASAAVVALGTKGALSAVKFQDQMSQVATLLDGDVNKRLEELGGNVKKLAMETGISTDMLTEGLYNVISALGDSADSMKILETATKGASAGNATVSESIDLLSAITKGYGDISAEAAQKASDLAFETLKLGQTSFSELAANMGKVIPLAVTMKVSQEELFGAMATLTGVTGNTAEVTTQLRATLQGFMQPTAKMEEALKRLGYANGMAALESEGLQGILEKLKQSVNDDEIAFTEFFGSVLAKNSVLALTGAQAEAFTEKTKAMYEAIGATDRAFEKRANTVRASWERIKQTLNVGMINLGEKILPLVQQGLNLILTGIDKFKEVLDENAERIERIKAGLMATFSPEGEGGGAIAWFIDVGIPSMVDGLISIAEGVTNIAYFVKDNWSLIAPIVYGIVGALTAYHVITKAITIAKYAWTAAQWALNVAMNANPLGLVITGIGLLIAAGVALVKNWDKIKFAGANLWNSIVDGAQWMANKVIDGINKMVEGAIKPINKLIRGINKVPGIKISEIEFGGVSRVDWSTKKFAVDGSSVDLDQINLKLPSDEVVNPEAFTPPVVESNTAAMNDLTLALNENTATMKGTAGQINDIHVTLYASDLTAEEVADILVPKIRRKLFA